MRGRDFRAKVLLGLLVLGMAVATACGRSAEKVPAPMQTPVPAALDSTAVSFTTSDGMRLGGQLFGNSKKGVVLAHMDKGNQRDWYSFARRLAEKGFLALTFDFRGYPTSPGYKDFAKADLDMEAALNFLRQQGVEKVYLIGAGMGGTAALVVAGRQEVDGVVTLSAPVEFQGLDARKPVLAVRAPKLFLAATQDETAAQSAIQFYEQALAPADLHLFTGRRHGTALLEGAHAKDLEARLLDFLEKGLPPSPTPNITPRQPAAPDNR